MLRPISRISFPALALLAAALVAPSLTTTNAAASPVLLAGAGNEKVHSTQVTILKNGPTTVVTVMPDYQGGLSDFAVVIPVPSDVTVDRISTIKREFVDRVDTISAPRFAEFWEMEPCEPGEAQQDWERNLKVDENAAALLGSFKTEPDKKVAKELLLDVKAQTKAGEYTFALASNAEELSQTLAKGSLKLPAGGDAAVAEYAGQGFKFLIATVDTKRVELVGGDRAQLSPIRFWTDEGYSKIPARFGLSSAAPAQELLIYTMAQGERMQVGNYPTKSAPTNVTVDFAVKERMGEFYAALHDIYLQKNPGTFLLEYAYSTADCGKPCPNEPLLPHELMSLGGDVIDGKLPKEVTRPKPPEPTAEDENRLKVLEEGKKGKEKADAKKEWELEREELAARKALLERHKYVLSRLHYRYSKEQLPKDPELQAGGAIRGGVALPKGPDGAADPAVQAATDNEFQTRYNNLHPSISQTTCDAPVRHRWGKAPITYRGLRKIWVAEDLSRKNRKQIQPEAVVVSGVPELGLAGTLAKKAAEAAAEKAKAAQAAAPKEESSCSSAPGNPGQGSALLLVLAGAFSAYARRRTQGSAK